MRHLTLALAASLLLAGAPPADATPGLKLDAAMKLGRSQKRDVMGVVYYVQKGVVVSESWNSELAGWTDKRADQLRVLAVGKRKLVKKEVFGNVDVFFRYQDGLVVKYNKRRGRVITMDVSAKGFKPATVAKGTIETVQDWKDAPFKGKAW